MPPQQPLIGARQPVFRQMADHLKQRRSHLVVKIFRGKFFLPRLGKPGANLVTRNRKWHCGVIAGTIMLAPISSTWSISGSHSGIPHTRIDNAAGTSYEMCAAACKPRCAPSRLSRRSVSRRRNRPNIRGKTETAQTRRTEQTPTVHSHPLPSMSSDAKGALPLGKRIHRRGSQRRKSKLPRHAPGAASPHG